VCSRRVGGEKKCHGKAVMGGNPVVRKGGGSHDLFHFDLQSRKKDSVGHPPREGKRKSFKNEPSKRGMDSSRPTAKKKGGFGKRGERVPQPQTANAGKSSRRGSPSRAP